MAAPAPIRLADDVDAWARQPGESTLRYGQFVAYRDLGRTRTLADAARHLERSDGYIRQVASAFHWVTRAQTWDTHLDAQYRAGWVAERIRGAENDARVLGVLTAKIGQRLNTLDPNALTVDQFIRLVDVVMRHRRALFGPADQAAPVGASSGVGDPFAGELAEFTDLPPEARKRRLVELTAQAEARAAALSGRDDD